MKIILLIFFGLTISCICKAQLKPQYNIKVVQKNKHRTKALFYAITNKELILLRNNSDTIKVSFASVKDLYINKKGVILPFMLIGAGVFVVLAAESNLPLEQFAYLFAGIPIGIAAGNLVGQLFANKRFYRGLVETDFPNIRTDLEKYTQIIYQPITD